MFNKPVSNQDDVEREPASERQRQSRVSPGSAATVGASVHMDGRLSGEEDLLIEGKVTGTIEFKQNTVTVGSKGHILADLYAKHCVLEGKVEGNVFAAESIMVRKSAHVTGRLVAPAVSLEQGGYFSGTVDMDAETEDLKKSFASKAASKPSKPSNDQATQKQATDKDGAASLLQAQKTS